MMLASHIMPCLGLCLKICAFDAPRLPRGENARDHMIESDYPDTEVVILMYAVIIFMQVSCTYRVSSFVILYYRNSSRLCLDNNKLCLAPHCVVKTQVSCVFKHWLALSCLKIESPWFCKLSYEYCLEKLSLVYITAYITIHFRRLLKAQQFDNDFSVVSTMHKFPYLLTS